VKALDGGDARAALPIAGYKKLYEIEAEIRDKDEDAKRAARQARSKEVFDDIVAWCRAYQPNEPPSSALGKAIQYALNHREALARFLEHGAIPIDNGIVERLHVRAAMMGSLCFTPSSTRKLQGLLVRRNATRAMATPITRV